MVAKFRKFQGVSNKLIAILYIASIFAIILGLLTAFYLGIQLNIEEDMPTMWRVIYFFMLVLDIVFVVALFGYIYKIKASKDNVNDDE